MKSFSALILTSGNKSSAAFSTSRSNRRLTESIKSQSDAAEKQVEAARAGCKARLSAESFDSMEQLAGGITLAQQHHSALSDAAEHMKAERDTAIAAYQNAAKIDGRFKEHLAAEDDLARIRSLRGDIDAVENRLKVARIVASLADAATARDTARREASDARRRQTQSIERLQSSEANAQSARATLDVVLQKSAEIEKQKDTLHTFRGYRDKLDASDGLKANRSISPRTARIAPPQHKSQGRPDALTSQKDKAANALQNGAVRRSETSSTQSSRSRVAQALRCSLGIRRRSQKVAQR